MVAKTIPVEAFDLVVFGATGDLARRKILPGLYRRMTAGQMPHTARVIGLGRSRLEPDDYRRLAAASLREFVVTEDVGGERLDEFLECLDYLPVDVAGDAGWQELGEKLRDDAVRVFYFSVAPSLFGSIAARTVETGLASPDCRIVVEKPFGGDLASARVLNGDLAKCFEERQIYRIDHYLGKETVQNLMALRFGNALFEPVWNAQHVDHVQITVAENLGISGRAEYYDQAGAMRDMVQNHIMQLLCLTAMEPPARFEPDAVRDEKLKIIKALEPVSRRDVVRGRYRAGGGVGSYLEECGNAESSSESFVALKASVANWRWSGTPFYLRTGKRMKSTLSEVVIVFKDPPHWIFGEQIDRRGNVLSIRLQPDEGITMRMTIKDPGPGGMRLTEVPLDMTFAEALGESVKSLPDAYERLIMDVVRGNQTLFMRGDEVEAAWEWVDPVIADWTMAGTMPFDYDPGSSGPEEALFLMHRDNRRWRDL